MSVSESGMGQCECEASHVQHSFHESGNARRCQRKASKIVPSLWAKPWEVGVNRPPSYVCAECAAFHELQAASAHAEKGTAGK